MAFTEISTDIYGIEIPDGEDGSKAEFLLDNRDGKVRANLLPFLGGVPDSSQITFEVNNGGGVFGPRIPQATGFKWTVAGGDFDGWELYALDLQENKHNVPDFYGEGWLLAYRFAKADAPAVIGGEIRIDKMFVSGDFENYTFVEQPVVNDTDISPVWNERAWRIKHAYKCSHVNFHNGVARDRYGTGKAGHMPRPRIELLDGATRKGGVWGHYEKTNLGDGTILVTKVFDEAEILAKVAEVGGANFTHFVVDATLGNTGIGASHGIGNRATTGGAFRATENGEVDSITSYRQNGYDTFKMPFALYTGDTLVATAKIANSDIGTDVVWNVYAWYTSDAYATKPTFSSGDLVWMVGALPADGGLNRLKYDTGGSATDEAYFNASSGQTSPLSASLSTLTAATGTFTQEVSTYITYIAATTPPTTTNAAVDPSSVAQGVSSALSADITDVDHTITAAEYFIGADPGEGSGTAMSLGAGTTSREATATIATGALAVDDHTVSVRGFDATDGWGAVDTVVLTVTEAVVGGTQQKLNITAGHIGL